MLDLIVSAQSPRAAVDDQVERLLEAATDASNEVLPRPHIALGASLDQRLRPAIAHMHEHVSDKATIDEIAGRVGL